jgi:hypothetical protein
MSRRPIITTALFCAVGLTLLAAYAKSGSNAASASNEPGQSLQASTSGVEDGPVAPDLAAQPEAVKLSRRIGGDRFKAKNPPALIVQGVVSTGNDRQSVQLSRSRNATGERVELLAAGAATTLSWDASAGARSSGGSLALTERALLEQLVFDSVDQFMLAQLRGASYYVVARNVRPDDAPENYSGPLWTVVRIEDPATAEQKEPLSKWRLYYLNSSTGLIDRVVSESQGQRIEASLSDWTKQGNELSPSSITWSSNGQILMTFKITSVSLAAQ